MLDGIEFTNGRYKFLYGNWAHTIPNPSVPKPKPATQKSFPLNSDDLFTFEA